MTRLVVHWENSGKTLTAEAYAEKMKRPLYEVDSSQVGTNPEQVEENLKVILERSKRLRMPLVINEADVYIRKRGEDMNQNAIVGVFLQMFEYHSGLIFLTTNRVDDIDDAIESRCLAIIQYRNPSLEERKRLWPILTSEMACEVPDGLCDELAEITEEGKVSGRDIQNWIRVTQQWMEFKDQKKANVEVFRRNAAFRGISVKKVPA